MGNRVRHGCVEMWLMIIGNRSATGGQQLFALVHPGRDWEIAANRVRITC